MKTVIEPSANVMFLDSGRYPQNPPDPQWPDGQDIDVSKGARKVCAVRLPYPAPRCGQWLVVCNACGFRALVTAAGRLDDPRSVTLPCKDRVDQ